VTDQNEIDRVAHDRFGLSELRPGQRNAIAASRDGRDVLVVWATGSGKSAVYQVAAALRGGVTVVVSPLIALQADQLEALHDAVGAPAAVALNSTLGAKARAQAWRRLHEGTVEYLFLAPEQLAKEDVMAELATLDVGLLVIDEAHCISSWGHDFRPDYLLIGDAAARLGRPPILALTATASNPVREEIIDRLGMSEPVVLLGDMDRPNIDLQVQRYADDRAKREAVVVQVLELPHPGLLYTATRREAHEYAEQLLARGVRAAAYHAGLPARERTSVHERFLDDELDVVVATSAFGMGIDKQNVRFVVHADVPDSIDAYYQEFGRAGRDGEAAHATLHYRPEDLSLRRFFAAKSPHAAEIREVIHALENGHRTRADLTAATGVSPRRLTALLTLLADTASVRMSRNSITLRRGIDGDDATIAAVARSEEREHIDRSRVEMLRGYAETRRCRRQILLGYFGQDLDGPCGNCDTCRDASAFAGDERRSTDAVYRIDDHVEHREWGEGTIMAVDEDRITVFFESRGYKVLSRQLIEEHDLVRITA
jgi:ATP-dependent DNA helicase RecQ